jgi:protein ImuB
MEGFLAARQAAVRAFAVRLRHDEPPETAVEVALAAPGREAEHFARLLRERLGALSLRAPVESIRIEADGVEPLAGRNDSLFDDPRGAEEGWLRLVERLQARLGREAVHGLGTHEDHRPERASRRVFFEAEKSNPGERKKDTKGKDISPRPLWLLDPPRRLAEGEFALLAGPERIESGWWDGAEACRDYFIARTGEASLAWIYREREGHWFLHGFFA